MSATSTPNQVKVQKTLANACRACQEMELAGLEEEDVMVQIEQANRRSRMR